MSTAHTPTAVPRTKLARSRRPMVAALITIMAIASICYLAARSATTQPSAIGPARIEAPVVTASPSSVTLGCPGGLDDPQAVGNTRMPAQWWVSPAGSSGVNAGGNDAAKNEPHVALTVTGERVQRATALVLSGNGGGELRSLVLDTCRPALQDQWVALGSTLVGEDVVLQLVNPSDKSTQVSIDAISESGPTTTPGPAVVVPPQSRMSLLAASWFPGYERLALHVRADGPGVIAWAQSSGMNGETPLGLTRIAGQPASLDSVIALPDRTALESAAIRIAVPSGENAQVTLSVLNPVGTTPLAGTDQLTVDNGTVLDVDISTLDDQARAIRVQSDVPIATTVMVKTVGSQWNGSQTHWEDRDASVGVAPVTTLTIPARQDLGALLSDILAEEQVARPTALETASGAELSTMSVLVTTGANATQVSIGDLTYDLPAGTSTQIDLDEAAEQTLEASQPVHVSLALSVKTPTGMLHAVTGLDHAGLEQGQETILMTPSR